MDSMKNYLVVVDMQKDFIDGSLGSEAAVAIVKNAAARIRGFEGEVLYTLDTHGENYLSTQEGGRLPVKHCIEDTEGWKLNETIREALLKRDAFGGEHEVRKCTFGASELPMRIAKLSGNAKRISITLIGLCTDICVISNAMLLKAFFPEAPIFVDASCCAGVTKESHKTALDAMRQCQIEIVGE